MRLLILGGTKFVGRHLVEAALSRHHEIVLFNRGLTNPELFPEVEKVRGDRAQDLAAVAGREFDVAIDTSGYVPEIVERSTRMLENSIGLYVFVSSISVYSNFSRDGLDESAPVLRIEEVSSDDEAAGYGAGKIGCEEQVRSTFGERGLIVRPGLIVGPHDPTNRFTYWVTRMARGGRVLAPSPRDRLVQFIDARDLAEWMVQMAEASAGGTFNAVGPKVAFGEVLDACIEAAGAEVSIEWVDSTFLKGQGVEEWSELPLWIDDDAFKGFMSVDASRAVAAGLRFRPVLNTVVDTLAWATDHTGPVGEAGLSVERERELLVLFERKHRPSSS